MTPELPPDVQEALDCEEEAFMHRRTAMEEYGGMMAKIFSQMGDGDDDPAKQDMIKQAFADIMCPKQTKPVFFPAFTPPARPIPIPDYVFEHVEGLTVTVYDFNAYVGDCANFQRDVHGNVKFFSALDELVGALQDVPAKKFWEWYQAVREWQKSNRGEHVDAEFQG